jgi:hypothetical protein
MKMPRTVRYNLRRVLILTVRNLHQGRDQGTKTKTFDDNGTKVRNAAIPGSQLVQERRVAAHIVVRSMSILASSHL